ncbi:hypothetical protein DH2020_030204 [Rehmannia glutinosa]|uniref:Uncharacterized protein n=1 Tax=Rehmannia glutinosa TaxID=99300 RepID=A0ABR0VN27_REHGL
MENPNLNPNPEVNQLPEADSLPDGFVESSSAAPLEEAVNDYKEEKLLELGSRPEVVIEDEGSSSDKLVENVGDQSQSAVGAAVERAELQTVASEVISAAGTAENNKKYVEATEVKRKSVKRAIKSEKEFLEFTLKYQQVIAERDSAVAVRDKLESLCRELQRQNKLLMDECKRVSTEGQNLRLDLSDKFQDAIMEVSKKLEEQKDECISQLKENEMLKTKLKQLVDQYTLSEQQHAQQEALVKSNEVFETFKQEIEKMAKSIKELKKENTFLKSKCEKSDVTLIELAEERERLKKQLEKTRNQKEKLESLCRSLQAERKTNPVGGNSSDSIPV